MIKVVPIKPQNQNNFLNWEIKWPDKSLIYKKKREIEASEDFF